MALSMVLVLVATLFSPAYAAKNVLPERVMDEYEVSILEATTIPLYIQNKLKRAS